MTDFITVANDGQKIVKTNYWDSEYAKNGYYYLTVNAGCLRLLVPESYTHALAEISTGKKINIELGWWQQQNRDAAQIIFEDGTSAPYFLTLSHQQMDRKITPEFSGASLAVWTEKGLFKDWDKIHVKKVETLIT